METLPRNHAEPQIGHGAAAVVLKEAYVICWAKLVLRRAPQVTGHEGLASNPDPSTLIPKWLALGRRRRADVNAVAKNPNP